jgi:hypothetical protein
VGKSGIGVSQRGGKSTARVPILQKRQKNEKTSGNKGFEAKKQDLARTPCYNFDVMLQTISPHRGEAASPPLLRCTTFKKSSYRHNPAVCTRGPQIHAVPCSLHRCPRLVETDRLIDTIGHAGTIWQLHSQSKVGEERAC